MKKNEDANINIRDGQYITIMGWMRNMPEIETNNELMAYALIYGFSQTEGQYLTCRQSYIACWLNISRPKCNQLLSRMENKGLIKRKVAKKYGIIKTYKYYCVLPCEKKDDQHQQENNESLNGTHRVTLGNTCELPKGTRSELPKGTRSELPKGTHDNNIYNNNNNIYICDEKTNHTPKSKNQFLNFEQNEYDFESLEKYIISN